jgi:hypothetical protein
LSGLPTWPDQAADRPFGALSDVPAGILGNICAVEQGLAIIGANAGISLDFFIGENAKAR